VFRVPGRRIINPRARVKAMLFKVWQVETYLLGRQYRYFRKRHRQYNDIKIPSESWDRLNLRLSNGLPKA